MPDDLFGARALLGRIGGMAPSAQRRSREPAPRFGAEEASPSAGIGKEVRIWWKDAWERAAVHGMGGGERGDMSREQRGELEELLRRYGNDDDAAAVPLPGRSRDEEGGGNTGEGGNGGIGGRLMRKSSGPGEGCFCTESLTYGERLLGCAIFYGGGLILNLGSLTRFTRLIEGKPRKFGPDILGVRLFSSALPVVSITAAISHSISLREKTLKC